MADLEVNKHITLLKSRCYTTISRQVLAQNIQQVCVQNKFELVNTLQHNVRYRSSGCDGGGCENGCNSGGSDAGCDKGVLMVA